MNLFIRSCQRGVTLSAAALLLCALPSMAQELPEGFSRLSDVEPSIAQDMKYAGGDNFLGRPAKGYEAGSCILTEPAAQALKRVQRSLVKAGFSLVVFDCYRPASAVADFVAWTKKPAAVAAKWSPRTPGPELIAQGYIGAKSSHSRGSTVDLAIIDTKVAGATYKPACGSGTIGLLDFGSGFDCFDAISRVANKSLSPQASRNRRMLSTAMSEAGFRGYAGEWWHFTFRNEPFPDQRFDFPVK